MTSVRTEGALDGSEDIKRRFRSFADGEEELAGLVTSYLRSMDGHLRDLEKAVAARDAGKVERQAHSAAGPCDLFGVAALAGLLRELEHAAGRSDLGAADGLMGKIRGEYERTRSRLA